MGPGLLDLNFALRDQRLHSIFVAEFLTVYPVILADTKAKVATNFEHVVGVEEAFFWNVTLVIDPGTHDTIEATLKVIWNSWGVIGAARQTKEHLIASFIPS